MRNLIRILSVLALMIGIAAAADVPFLSGRVVDDAEILSTDAKRNLTDKLKAHEDRTGDQIAVLTVKTLGGENIEEYATRVFESWKLGKKGKDNGVLLVVASGDRRMRIEVGYGLEGTLTDLLAGRIIRNVMAPRFKAGDYNGGVTAGVDAIVAVLEKGELPAMAGGNNGTGAVKFNLPEPNMPIMQRILIGAFIFGIIGLFTAVGIVTPRSGWFLYVFLIPFWAMFPVLVIGATGTFILLVLYLVGFPIAKMMLRNKSWYQQAAEDLRTKGRASIGGFMMTGGGSWGGWSSGGGGGFSGGGGSSGGGGASGGW